METHVHIKTCTQMSVAALLTTTAHRCKQPTPTAENEYTKRGHQTVEYYSALRKNEALPPVAWMRLENITLSARSQSHRATDYAILLL